MAATAVVGGSTRWCPTAEQLMILEEMYRGGLRTPNATQIQQITAHLALYGRIEGKNVFYWFQNHKARDRQKLRRRLCMSHHLLSCAHYYAAAAAASGHQHQLFGTAAAGVGAGAVPAMAPQQQHYSCGGAGLDQQVGHLLATTPTPAAAYAAGYCYPFGSAVQPSRCAGATPSPPNPLFNYQGGGGGGGLPEYTLGRLGNIGVVEDYTSCAASTVPSGYELAALEAAAAAAGGDQAMMTSTPPPTTTAMGFCRPLKTLDLFPGALKEEQRDVA